MKKLIYVCFFLVSTNCFSQTVVQSVMKRLSFGIKGGVNYSNYANTDFTTEALMGFHAGALVNFKITNKLSVQEEFLFSSQGATIKDGTFGQEDEDVKVYYFTVPMLLKYRTRLGIYVEGGTQVGMRTKEDIGDIQSGEFAKKLDMGVIGGVGFQLKRGFGLGARYCAACERNNL